MPRPDRATVRLLGTLAVLSAGACARTGPRDRCPWTLPELPGRNERAWTATGATGVIEGRVEDFATGAPLSGIGVWLVRSRAVGGGPTNGRGEFRITGVATGPQVVRVFARYPNVQDTVILKPGGGMRARIRLEPSRPPGACVVIVE